LTSSELIVSSAPAIPARINISPFDVPVLENVQKRAVNIINGLKSDTYEGKFKELGIQSLADRRMEVDMVLIFKVIRGHCPDNKEYGIGRKLQMSMAVILRTERERRRTM
jgi:hypothetical protein